MNNFNNDNVFSDQCINSECLNKHIKKSGIFKGDYFYKDMSGTNLDIDNNIDGYTLADIMTLAATLLGRHKTIEIRLPRWILKTIAVSNVFIARICGITPMLTPEKVREIYHASWVAEGDFVQDYTPWQSRYSLEQGLSETLQWYRQEKLL